MGGCVGAWLGAAGQRLTAWRADTAIHLAVTLLGVLPVDLASSTVGSKYRTVSTATAVGSYSRPCAHKHVACSM